jgi:hypothetical protein
MDSLRLLHGSRSRWHHRWFRASALGGAVVVGIGLPGGGLLVATNPEKHSALWTVVLAVVIAVTAVAAVVSVVAGVGAFVTQPVSEQHAAVLRRTAATLEGSLASGDPANYGGNGYRPEQAFSTHFPKLGKRLAAWDEMVGAPGAIWHSYMQRVDALMAEHGVTAPTFDVSIISAHMRAFCEMSEALGDAVVRPPFQWSGFSSAGHPDVPGPPYGTLRPYLASADWIILTPLDGESESEWRARADLLIAKADAFAEAAYASVPYYVRAIRDANGHLDEFKQAELPAIVDALKLIQAREAPRVRHRCESC